MPIRHLIRGRLLKQVAVTGISTVSFTGSFPQILQQYCRYNNLVCQYNLPLCQMLSDVSHTDRLAVLDTLILTTVRIVYLTRILAHGECDWSTGDAYS
jgi:hypothetical protein